MQEAENGDGFWEVSGTAESGLDHLSPEVSLSQGQCSTAGGDDRPVHKLFVIRDYEDGGGRERFTNYPYNIPPGHTTRSSIGEGVENFGLSETLKVGPESKSCELVPGQREPYYKQNETEKIADLSQCDKCTRALSETARELSGLDSGQTDTEPDSNVAEGFQTTGCSRSESYEVEVFDKRGKAAKSVHFSIFPYIIEIPGKSKAEFVFKLTVWVLLKFYTC